MVVGQLWNESGAANAAVAEVVRGAHREVLCTGSGPGFEVVRPDLRVRLLCAPPDDRTRDRVRELIRRGVRVKVAGERVHDALVVDRRLAVVVADGVPLALTAPPVVAALVEWFFTRWATGVPWAVASGEPGDFERSVLRCLVEGMTDEVAADRLGVSARTVRRYVNVLMDLVGARSRFELGFRAAESSWLDEGPDVPRARPHLDHLVPIDV